LGSILLLWNLKRDSSSYKNSEWLSHQIAGIAANLYFILLLSPTSVTLASFDGPTRAAVKSLSTQLAQVVSIIPSILSQHKRFLTSAKNDTVVTLKMGLELAYSHSRALLPFLDGKFDMNEARKSKGYVPVSWWDCEVTRVERRQGTKACSRSNLMACSRVSFYH